MTKPAAGTVTRPRWRCLWDGCPAYGVWVNPPPGLTCLEDGQQHHRTAHGVQPDRPGIHFPDRLGALRRVA